MQMRRSFKEKFIASLLVFMMMFSNFATLGTALVAYAADDGADGVVYSVQFVEVKHESEEPAKSDDGETEVVVQEAVKEDAVQEYANVQESSVAKAVGAANEQENVAGTTDEKTEAEEDSSAVVKESSEGVVLGEESDEKSPEEEPVEQPIEERPIEEEPVLEEPAPEQPAPEQPIEEQPIEEPEVQPEENEPEEGLAIEITVGVKNSGYLKNAKVQIKDLADQIFKMKENISLGEYIQSIDENKIKLKQINGGTEVKIYIPIELKSETTIDMKKLQEGVEVSLLATYVDNEGNEGIITRSAKPVLNISNDVNLVLGSTIEKCIPYVRDGINEALVQIKVTATTETDNKLPIKDTTYEVSIPQIEGTEVKNVSVSAVNTAYTNGKASGDVVFTAENWSYQDGKVTIGVDNVEKDGRYQKNNGQDEFIISYTYSNCPELNTMILKSTISATSNVFNASGLSEVTNTIEKEYDLSQANSNIITYGVTSKTQDVSKGYLYANSNSDVPEYEVEFEKVLNVNISRVDLIKTIEIRESAEYFLDDDGNQYATSLENGKNTYYKSVKLNRENLLSIIGEEGNLELLLEDGTSLIQVNKDTDYEDGYITISFGENKIDKILMRINNPMGDGILNIGTVKAIDKLVYEKSDLMLFRALNNEYVAAAQLEEDIITEMGTKVVTTNLIDTITNATISLSRNELSTLVENENIEMNISLNNASATSDMYKNPVFELTFPEEVENVKIVDMNLLYGNDELEIANIETLRNDSNQIVLRITLNGAQTKYTLGDSEKGTTIILKASMSVNMYRASREGEVVMNYYNEDATNYALGSDWQMLVPPSSYMLSGRQGICDTSLKIVAPEGFVNAQMISNYKEGKSLISVNQGTKSDTIDTFVDAKTAEMKMVLINNTDEQMKDVHILGRTIFSGNKEIISGDELGTNQDAPMVSKIVPLGGNRQNATIYYSEKAEATDDLENSENGWTVEPEDLGIIKSFLIVIDGNVEIGDILMYSYNFEIPAKLTNNLDLCGTFGTYYTGTKTAGIIEADKVVLSTGDAPVLKVETISNADEFSAVEGQRIKYTVRVTNEGRSISENTVVNSIIPDGTTYVENGELKPDVAELKIDMGNINPGKSEEVTYEVEVDKDASSHTEIKPDNNIEANGLEKPVYTTVEKPILVQVARANVRLTSDLTGYVIQKDRELTYTIHVVNKNGNDLTNCEVVQTIPEGVDFVEAYAEEFEENGITTYKGEAGVYDSKSRTVRWNLDSIADFKNFKVKVVGSDISEVEKNLSSTATLRADNLDNEYTSNELNIKIARPIIEMDYYANSDNKYIKEGDTVEYILELKNVGGVEATKIDVSNNIPKELTVLSAECTKDDGTKSNALAVRNLNVDLSLASGQSAKVALKCIVENLPNDQEEQITGNNWVVSGTNIATSTTEKIENIVQQNPEIANTVYENMQVDTTDKKPVSNQTSNVEINTQKTNEKVEVQEDKATYRILGRAFNDFNKNGQRDDDEEGMANIVAKLCDAQSQEIVSQAVTNNIGEYLFEDVIPGEYYIKFEYDNTQYTLSDYRKDGVNSDRNSDAIISNYKAVTDKIKVTDRSISDIDIGLIKSGIFDLSVEASINKVTVQNDKETVTYEMENPKLAKVDINPKYADSSKLFIEYTIEVANKGEIAGYAKRLVDYLPEELSLDTTINPNWYIGADGNAYTQELEDVLIRPGETKIITLVLTKQMTEDGTGIINNSFEIDQTYNEYAISDIDSTPGNKAQDEDDMSRADIILGIQTGGSLINVMIISTTLITLLIALYVVKVQIDKKNKEVIV